MTQLEMLLERTGCADELAVYLRPNNWEQLMGLVAAGVIDADELDEATAECAALA